MPRRLSIIALFAAWFCTSGVMLDVAQVFAWANMFTRYAAAMPLEQAAVETVDPGKPCPLCRAIRRARDQSDAQQPANAPAAAEKLLLVFHEVPPVVFARSTPEWPNLDDMTAATRSEPVPVPPPRTGGRLAAA